MLTNNFGGGSDKLGANVAFMATFYGELKFEVLAVKFDTLNGFSLGGKTTIGGKFGISIELSIDIELTSWQV
ncbi:hypothetical protein B4Q04_14450 [Zobellia sp. OII3]|uniref:hypothetical protein n=1 Tax=Zobellia sp. OII3 TaxID=2034520 RepID=UPI000B5324A8|nr:hypothetical protein [Zobellia sp. OII3]OWW24514.1 hypothetical protein B4Q04_14450 [Zobellia sp. OII3]